MHICFSCSDCVGKVVAGNRHSHRQPSRTQHPWWLCSILGKDLSRLHVWSREIILIMPMTLQIIKRCHVVTIKTSSGPLWPVATFLETLWYYMTSQNAFAFSVNNSIMFVFLISIINLIYWNPVTLDVNNDDILMFRSIVLLHNNRKIHINMKTPLVQCLSFTRHVCCQELQVRRPNN